MIAHSAPPPSLQSVGPGLRPLPAAAATALPVLLAVCDPGGAGSEEGGEGGREEEGEDERLPAGTEGGGLG